MLRSDGRGANPFIIRSKFNTSLEHNVYHIVSASMVRTNIDATILPRFVHLITAMPISEKHHTVVGCRIELSYLVLAEFDALMKSTHFRMIFMRSR